MRLLAMLIRVVWPGALYAWIVARSAQAVIRRRKPGSPRIVRHLQYGATYVNPKHLAVWYLVGTNIELADARASGLEQAMAADTRTELRRRRYPAAAIDQIHVGMESIENVDKAGSASRYFK